MKNVLLAKSKAAFSIAVFFCVFGQAAFSQKIKSKEYESNPFAGVADNVDADELQILSLVNAERTKRGLSQLISDDKIADIARDYSKKMARENFFSHYDANGNSVLERAKTARLKHWSKIGENLFSVEGLANFDAFAVKNWMKSPAHRENILDKEWTTTGVGIAESKDGEIFITQIFIKRQ